MRAEQAVDREAEQAKDRKMQTAISLGATVLGAFLGRKAMSTSTLGRATTTMRDVSRSMDEAGDVKRAERPSTVKQKQADLEAEFQAELDALEGKADPATETLEKVLMRPRKSDITVDSLGLVWMPYWQDASGSLDRRLGISQGMTGNVENASRRSEREERMLKDFKAFIDRGNLLQLAVAFILGVAFAAVVTSLVNDIIMPAVGLATGGVDFNSHLRGPQARHHAGPVPHRGAGT